MRFCDSNVRFGARGNLPVSAAIFRNTFDLSAVNMTVIATASPLLLAAIPDVPAALR
jgi:hypothetical protein